MKSSNPKNKNPDIYLKIALVGSFGMFVLCLTYCLASFQFRGAVESQRMHPTLTPELYKNALDMVHFSYFIALPAMGFCNLVIGVGFGNTTVNASGLRDLKWTWPSTETV
jgi:hypothetical protein